MGQEIHTIIIGGGPAGLAAAIRLGRHHRVLIMEKEAECGGKLNQWDKLFPDFEDAKTVRQTLLQRLPENVTVQTSANVTEVAQESGKWKVTLQNGETHIAPTLLLATGFEPFNAIRKEEYGYGIYPNVITSVELESMIAKGEILTREGKKPQSVAYIQCVGSRDEKVGNHFCSVNCCICAVKQSIEVKQLLPQANQFCFYMDLRMSGRNYEERYRESQEKYHVNFIRGRVSETSVTANNQILVKAEDTLLSRPIKMKVDLLVLMVGMEPSPSTRQFAEKLGISDPYGYFVSQNSETADNATVHKGLFVAGSAKRPMPVPQALKEGEAAAWEIAGYLSDNL
ncbi:MAG: CoB--CoM heterodisulfide reductase iron-sulfur subunit A family protein [Bacteroidales bacterium]|nr:CoB--CoM heterodisulfide reductase iron-sulfur subunit A family protein [Bacteroidales bacterium]